MENNTLYSIIVLSYNSEKTITETLDSVFNQKYEDIELIISDDNSSDDTMKIVESWTAIHGFRFKNIKILSSSINTGVTKNANRGASYANGKWLKFLDADDKLVYSAIDDIHECLTSNPSISVLYSKVSLFGTGDLTKFDSQFKNYLFVLRGVNHLLKITTTNFITSASVTINSEYFKSLGGFDENIPFMEDWPFWIRNAYLQTPTGFLNKITAEYRVNQISLSTGNKSLNYRESERKLWEYNLSIQRKKCFLLYALSKTFEFSKKYNFIKCCIYANPIFYYLKIVDLIAKCKFSEKVYYEIN
jgi:glycosyltransferase involved in cell wall biosynthesis